LDSLPGFAGKTIGGDLTWQAKTNDGLDITVIWITIDDTDPKNGAATLKKAHRRVAPMLIAAGARSLSAAAPPSVAWSWRLQVGPRYGCAH